MKTFQQIEKMGPAVAKIYLNGVQREILAKNHGSEEAAHEHVQAVNALIHIAEVKAKATDLSTVKTKPWHHVSPENGRVFTPDLQSIAFHREMEKLKREHLEVTL